METIISIGKWLFFDSIYGFAIIAGVVFILASVAKKAFPKFINPAIPAAIVFFLAFIILPSIPRYQFEKDTLLKINGKNWIKIINQTKWGAITEPITWFRAPIGSFFVIMPNDPLVGGYREIIFRYKEDPRVKFADPDCQDYTIIYSEPDDSGVLRYTSENDLPMTEQDKKIYCEYDWTKEIEALRNEVLNQPTKN